MPGLETLQRDFMAALYAAEASNDAPIEIYRRNLRAHLGAALAATFPVVERLVGPSFFRAAAERFVAVSPSRSGDLHAYGEDFPAFLATDAHARELGYLADVARVEWARSVAFHSANAHAFDFVALANVEPARRASIRLRLHASVRVIDSSWPVVSIWEANQPGCDGSVPDAWTPQVALVHRDATAVRTRAIDRQEASFLEALASGVSLEQAVDRLGDPASLDRRLMDAIRGGVIEGFSAA